MDKYGLIGKSLAHSESKLLHSYLGNYEYEYIELESAEQIEAVLKDESYDGFNVTIPYKQEIIKYLDEISDSARRAGAVNCVRRLPDGRLKGHNTDIYGFRMMIGDKATDARCIVLGTGGGARAVAVALEKQGASEVVMVSRNPQNKSFNNFKVISYDQLSLYYDADIIVNATPVGQMPDNGLSPLNENGKNISIFSNLKYAVDIVYNPFRTKFLQDARRITSCKTISGMEMLIFQAIASRNIWQGRKSIKINEWRMAKDIRMKLLRKQANIVAVGMPGSGKTTIFRRYAYEKKLDFYDIDSMTEELMGEKIQDVLAQDGKGEEYFRDMEFKAVKSTCSIRGSVIATGGGTILNPLSRDILRSNGIVIYLRRPLENLSTKNRPISQRVGVFELFNKRDKIYRRMADITISNNRTFGEKGTSGENAKEYFKDMKRFTYEIAGKIEFFIAHLSMDKWL